MENSVTKLASARVSLLSFFRIESYVLRSCSDAKIEQSAHQVEQTMKGSLRENRISSSVLIIDVEEMNKNWWFYTDRRKNRFFSYKAFIFATHLPEIDRYVSQNVK